MIKITYYRNTNRVAIEGHAKFAEKGKDLVCASVTILAYTLAAFVDSKEQEDKCWCSMCHFKEGDVIVFCSPNAGYKKEITEGFDTICRGFELLAEKFPKHISYERKDKSI